MKKSTENDFAEVDDLLQRVMSDYSQMSAGVFWRKLNEAVVHRSLPTYILLKLGCQALSQNDAETVFVIVSALERRNESHPLISELEVTALLTKGRFAAAQRCLEDAILKHGTDYLEALRHTLFETNA
jgi:hypothetical protein